MGERGEKDIWLLVAFSLPVSLSVAIRRVVLMPYLSLMGFTEPEMGLIAMVNSLFMAIPTIPIGILSDLRGRKGILILSRALVATSDIMFFLFEDLNSLLIASMLGGMGASMTSAIRGAFLADKARDDMLRQRAFTYSFALFSTGSVLGSFLAGLPDLLVSWAGMPLPEATRTLFAFCSISALISLALVVPVAEERRPPMRRMLMAPGSRRTVGSFCLFQALLGSGAGLIVPWFPYYFSAKFGVGFSELGVLFAITGISVSLGYLSASKLAGRLGDVRTAVICQLASLGATLAIPFSPDLTWAAVFYVMRTTLMNMAMPVLRALYLGLLRREERAFGDAARNTVFWGFRSLGSYGSGLLIEATSLDAPFFVSAILYIAATASLGALFGVSGRAPSSKN